MVEIIEGWECPDCGATSYKEVRQIVAIKRNPIYGGKIVKKTIPSGFYECCGCSRFFGNPSLFNKNRL